MHKDARGYAMRWLAALVVGCVAALGGCGGDAERAAQVQPMAAAVAPTTIPPTPTFASVAPEWLPTVLPDTPTPTVVPPTATPHAPSIATLYTTHDTTRLAAPRFNHTAALLPDSRVILGGGSSGAGSFGIDNGKFIAPIPATHFDVYDPAKGWSVIIPAGDDRAIFNASMVLMADGAVLAVGISGDETEENFSPAAAILDPATQLWTPLSAPSISSRDVPLLARLQDGRVIAVGDLQFSKDDGFAYLYGASETEIFDPCARQWQSASDTNNISESSTLVALQNGGALLVHNAYADDDEIGAEIYDPAADEWNVVPGIRGTRGTPKAVVLSDGRILVTGDIDIISEGEIDTISEEESRIDVEFITHPLDGGDIINEGNPLSPFIIFFKADIYDPATGAWTPTGGMLARYSALTLLPDGRVLASGGSGGKSWGVGIEFYMSKTEIYDPETNDWTWGPRMAMPRHDHTATALPDGRVLIAGGIAIHPDTGEFYPTNTSEIITVP